MFPTQKDNTDFIVGLSFHKLEQVTRHGSGGLLPFVLIRNALVVWEIVCSTRAAQQQQKDDDKAILEEQDLFLQEEEEEEQIWLEACFDNLDDNAIQFDREDDDDEENDEDSLMDDFGDMMFRSSAKRAGINPSYLAAAPSPASSGPGTSFFLHQHHLVDHSTDHLVVPAEGND